MRKPLREQFGKIEDELRFSFNRKKLLNPELRGMVRLFDNEPARQISIAIFGTVRDEK